jgi:outer membrane immunogenic protein
MKRLAGISFAAGMLAFSAFGTQAADLRAPVVKAPPVPIAVPFSWTGFYIGGHVGAVRGRGSFDAIVDQPVFPAFGFLGPLFPIIVPSRLGTIPGVSASDTSFLGGGQLGYNWQVGSFLLGFEGDASWTHVRASATFSPVDPFGFQTLNGTYTTEIDWMASLRARLGVTWDRLLIYATGGAAFAGGSVSSTFTLTNPTPNIFAPVPGATGTTAASANFTRVGWTIGGGLEYAFDRNWSLAGEYRYSDFGRFGVALASTDPSGILGLPTLATNVRLRTDQATLRLNYRFGL